MSHGELENGLSISPRDMNDYKRVRDQGDKRPRRAKLLANLHLNGTTYPAASEGRREGDDLQSAS